MCTISIVPYPGGFRMMCNRDERNGRPEAEAPRPVVVGGRVAVFPIDPQGGGTWIGANDAGLAIALLNRRPRARSPRPRTARSRGLIIPPLLASSTVADVIDAAASLDPSSYEPFRLVGVQHDRVAIVTSDAAALSTTTATLDRPRMFSSSSLGDERAESLRRPLFDRLVVNAGDSLAGQIRFHDHQWAHRRELSVRMQRDDARTVSRCRVDVHGEAVRMQYEPIPRGAR